MYESSKFDSVGGKPLIRGGQIAMLRLNDNKNEILLDAIPHDLQDVCEIVVTGSDQYQFQFQKQNNSHCSIIVRLLFRTIHRLYFLMKYSIDLIARLKLLYHGRLKITKKMFLHNE